MISTLDRYVDVIVTPQYLSDKEKLGEYRKGKINGAITPAELDKINALLEREQKFLESGQQKMSEKKISTKKSA